MQTGGGSDGVLFGAGTLRGDSTYGPGAISIIGRQIHFLLKTI